MFDYDPADYRRQLQQDGYVLLKHVLSADFISYMKNFFAQAVDGARESDAWRIAGKKRQWVFDFASPEQAEAFRAGMAALTAIPAEDFTISERHIKLYEADANPYPAPHKDRAASHFSIGLPIDLAAGSSVCVFPELEPGPNLEERAVFLQTDDAAPEAMYASGAANMLNEEVGDVVVFLGSTLYHERVRAAGSAILYIKVNGVGEDPLGENIFRAEVVALS